MQDFEKLGAFYLGKNFDTVGGKLSDELVLYDSKDLTTHAVIIGMTGSGKTGLGIGLLEEALVDNIPVIAIDPKGDLSNLLLSFPNLSPEEFRPWINLEEANRQNLDPDAFAAQQSDLWKKGLADWGQDASRIKKMRDSIDFSIYTPGSSAGLQVSVLRSFDVPEAAVMSDSDALRERIQTTVTGLLGLLGIDADPIRSREHILVSNIISSSWNAGKNLDLGGLIASIQQPPFQKIGVMDIESFYPSKDRFELAMNLNNLLASPGFSSWMEGEPFEIKNMLFTQEGKPRCTVFSIAHLGDAERMFFVTQLLNQMLGWMRSQPGTSSLRAVLYMDEIYGFFPPNGNPPSKTPMLTLLKQARAFGLGLVLSTQNPVDLDYKGLSNAGTWFVGRLQTDNDKARVLEALQGSGASGDLNRTLSSLGKRVFLMHNVHESGPITFQTRWTMSYLAGPMTSDQIKTIMAAKKGAVGALLLDPTTAPNGLGSLAAPAPTNAPASQTVKTAHPSRPVLPPQVKQFFIPASAESGVIYYPMALGAADVRYASTKYKIDSSKTVQLLAEITDNPVPVTWDEATPLEIDVNSLLSDPVDGAEFADAPTSAGNAKNFDKWGKDFSKWMQTNQALTLLYSSKLKTLSNLDESEQDFRIRLQTTAREMRDSQAEEIKASYQNKLNALEERLRKAQAAQDTQAAQAKQAQLETVVNVGMGILGALLGGGRKTNVVSKAATAMKTAGKAYREGQDVSRAADTVEAVQAQLTELLDAVNGVDVNEQLEQISVKPKATDVSLQLFALAWTPYSRDEKGRLNPAWE
jgi:Helicase HerA, central domain